MPALVGVSVLAVIKPPCLQHWPCFVSIIRVMRPPAFLVAPPTAQCALSMAGLSAARRRRALPSQQTRLAWFLGNLFTSKACSLIFEPRMLGNMLDVFPGSSLESVKHKVVKLIHQLDIDTSCLTYYDLSILLLHAEMCHSCIVLCDCYILLISRACL